MIRLLSDHIITPLGEGIGPNLEAIREGRTALRLHGDVHGERLVTPVMASLLDAEKLRIEGLTLFESFCVRAAEGACAGRRELLASDRTIVVVSSTKGDIWTPMAESAARVARYLGNRVEPIVVSTACTSGVSAQLAAARLLETGAYDTAVVIGTDVQREFIVSGFQSFQALSQQPCRPFDKAREGLNAGEAVACMVLTSTEGEGWQLLGGSIHNDANHISGPSRTAEGSLRCLEDALALTKKDDLACISVHGTATLYNDEMESIALHRAGLDDIPVAALKGYYGHTMGAAGLLETILTLHAADEGILLPALGYSAQGTTHQVNISAETRRTAPATANTSVIKLLSGFGGVNAASVWKKGTSATAPTEAAEWEMKGEVRIDERTDLVGAYRSMGIAYPKFFKMDTLSRLTFVATEELLRLTGFEPDKERTDVVLLSRSASLKNDTDYQATIADHEAYYPSPALFVYTLPNIAAGEAAIRHGLYSETACYAALSEESGERIVEATLRTTGAQSVIAGWTECPAADRFEAHLRLFVRKQ